MGIGFLPWEKWLPAWVLGPLLIVISVAALAFDGNLHWWEYILLPLVGLLGVWQTWVWFKEGRNVLRDDPVVQSESSEKESR